MSICIVNTDDIMDWKQERWHMGHPIRQIFGVPPEGYSSRKLVVIAWRDTVTGEEMSAEFGDPSEPVYPNLTDRNLFITYMALSCDTWKDACQRVTDGLTPTFKGRPPATACAVDTERGPVHGRVILIMPADPVTCWDYTMKRAALQREHEHE